MASSDTPLAMRDIFLEVLIKGFIQQTQQKSALLSVRQAALRVLRFNSVMTIISLVGLTVTRVPEYVQSPEIWHMSNASVMST